MVSMNIMIDIITQFDADNTLEIVKSFETVRVTIKLLLGPVIGFVIDRFGSAIRLVTLLVILVVHEIKH